MPPIPNPNNGYVPQLKEIVKIIGGCHAMILNKTVQVVRVIAESPEHELMFFDEEWLFTSGCTGCFAPATEEEQAAFLAIPDRPDWV